MRDALSVYRILLGLALVANLAFWWAHLYVFPQAIDPLWVRLALSGALAVLLAASYFSEFIREHMRYVLIGGVYLATPHLLFGLYANKLGFFPTMNLVLLVGALAASFPFTFISVRSLSAYLLVLTVGAGFVLYFTDATRQSRILFALCLISLEAICFVALLFRYRALEKAHQAERALFANSAKLRRYDFIVNTSREFMTLISREYIYEAVNQSYISAHNRQREDIVGKRVWEIWGQELFENAIRPHLDDCFAGNDVNYQLPLQFPDQESRYYDISYYPYTDEDGLITHAVVVTRDITQQRRAEERLRHEALHDSLTGLANRSLLMDRVQHALQMAERMPEYGFAILLVDLDRFKIVNDSLGHHVGDRMLVETAGRLHSVLRRVDTVARLGGDEFAVLVNGARRPEDAIYVADRIIERMAAPFELEGVEIFTSATLGIALSEPSYKDPQQMLRDADTALYRAKQAGGGRYEMFRREMHLRALSLLHMGADLRRALGRGEVVPYYMPIVDPRTHRIVAVEALVRWLDPNRGMIPPARFIEFAEETGIIVEIGKQVLKMACEQSHRWRERGFDLRIAVNFSARQFQMPDLETFLADLLHEHNTPAESLELEITESAFMGHEDQADAALQALRDMGVRLAIDDFGTGYSSLTYLKRFPFHSLKIDRSFVMDSEAGRSRPILEAIVRMAHDMGLEVVAEGVETQAQLDMLTALGCDRIQGYYYSPAVPPLEMSKLLEAGPMVPRPVS